MRMTTGSPKCKLLPSFVIIANIIPLKCVNSPSPNRSLLGFRKSETPCATAKSVLPDEEPKTSYVIPVPVDEKPTTPQLLAERPLFVDEACEVLDQAQLESIGASTEIQDTLKNEDLRKLVCRINDSPNALEELEKAMSVDVFRVFSEKVLSAANSKGEQR
ncbi:uncharacterized protein LOC104899494 isoform X2 [Beta vulgaris subsp. vulgaris]|uniref:uncharacterized protein LOC104899494 isoform X2 n=1 Tax=Beta vulgaris subsp. vulgaris TaxID=3555 RepID=UPI00053FD2BB|nr:uncharacterized protein LOC104899494 isoform X2 [Beta vulgaris subsp. vulgaris]